MSFWSKRFICLEKYFFSPFINNEYIFSFGKIHKKKSFWSKKSICLEQYSFFYLLNIMINIIFWERKIKKKSHFGAKKKKYFLRIRFFLLFTNNNLLTINFFFIKKIKKSISFCLEEYCKFFDNKNNVANSTGVNYFDCLIQKRQV